MGALLIAQFSAIFSQNCVIPRSMCNHTEELSSWFHSNCSTVAPLKTRRPKTKSEPWLSDTSAAELSASTKRTICRCHFKGIAGIIIRNQRKMPKENTYLLLFCQTVTNLTFYLRLMSHREFALNLLLLFVKASFPFFIGEVISTKTQIFC